MATQSIEMVVMDGFVVRECHVGSSAWEYSLGGWLDVREVVWLVGVYNWP